MSANPSSTESDPRSPRRGYYRLNHEIPFAYRRVSGETLAMLERGEQPPNTSRDAGPTARLAALRVEATMALNQLRQIDAVMARYLQTVEKRLGILSEQIFEGSRQDLHKTVQSINLSASGVAFTAHDELPVGAWVEVEFDLPETKVSVHAFARIVRTCKSDGADCGADVLNVGAEMVHLSDTEREMVVAYMLGRQAERIRRDRARLGPLLAGFGDDGSQIPE
ncbi:MAG: PilZ domain-containing protein [Gammaproteobacteria bacterium]|nr:PilZ domain-containing protein [Gammaproteobacteria bacterium]